MKFLDENKKVIERDVIRAFSSAEFCFDSLENMCANLNDAESREETTSFLNLRWQEVSVSQWQRHYGALYFFTDQAFRYYLPSIMLQALYNLDETHLAVGALLSSLQSIEDDQLGMWNRTRWLGLTVDQIKSVIDWLDFMKNPLLEYGFNEECEASASNLRRMLVSPHSEKSP